jgi:hypothetical protein
MLYVDVCHAFYVLILANNNLEMLANIFGAWFVFKNFLKFGYLIKVPILRIGLKLAFSV